METIHVLFLKTRDDDHFLNQATARLGGLVNGNEGFCHVEICLPHPHGGYVSSSIYQGEKVSFNRQKTFANPGYVVHSMTVSSDQVHRMRHHVQKAHSTGVGFDKTGMYLAALPARVWRFGLHPNNTILCCCCYGPQHGWHDDVSPALQKRTFCSRYVTEVLRTGNVEAVDGVNPHITTPSKLYRILKEKTGSAAVAGSVEYKQNAMRIAETGIGAGGKGVGYKQRPENQQQQHPASAPSFYYPDTHQKQQQQTYCPPSASSSQQGQGRDTGVFGTGSHHGYMRLNAW